MAVQTVNANLTIKLGLKTVVRPHTIKKPATDTYEAVRRAVVGHFAPESAEELAALPASVRTYLSPFYLSTGESAAD